MFKIDEKHLKKGEEDTDLIKKEENQLSMDTCTSISETQSMKLVLREKQSPEQKGKEHTQGVLSRMSALELLICKALGKCSINTKDPVCFDGKILLILRDETSTRTLNVYMKILKGCPKHYAVIYRDPSCSFQYGYFNCADCIVKPNPENRRQFKISKTNISSGLLFEASKEEETAKCIAAFQTQTLCPFSPRNRRPNVH